MDRNRNQSIGRDQHFLHKKVTPNALEIGNLSVLVKRLTQRFVNDAILSSKLIVIFWMTGGNSKRRCFPLLLSPRLLFCQKIRHEAFTYI